jgi:hypothetical protein
MKKSLLVLAALCFLISNPVESQGLLNKVKKAVSKEISGVSGDDTGNESSKPGPEPACACDDADLIMDLGKYKVVYNEIAICTKDDGSILVKDRIGGKYYISRKGVSEGPYSEGAPEIAGFCSEKGKSKNSGQDDDWAANFPDYISKSGEKYLVRFNGKNFGPYAMISDFAVSSGRDKFAAVVTENMVMTEDQGKKLEKELENAKTDQERMDISMRIAQQMQDQIAKGGGPESLQPKLVSNVPGAKYDMMEWGGGRLNSSVKFNDLLVIAPDRIIDLTGKTVMKLSQSSYNYENMYVNSSNTLYATYNYGTLTFSDNKTLSEVFSPYVIKTDGKVYLTYMYYSPGKDAIMQCAVPF